MMKVCRFEPFADWGDESKLFVAKEGLSEPKKIVIKLKGRVHAINDIKGG
jgi:hypothetical protein